MYFARLKDNFCGNDPKIPWILWLKMTHWATDESEYKNSWTKSNCIHLSYKSKMEPVYNNSIPEIADNTKTTKKMGKHWIVSDFMKNVNFMWSFIFCFGYLL